MVDNAEADDGVPLDFGVDLRIGDPLEQRLNLVQCGAQPDTDAEKPVARRVSSARKDLMKVYFADAGPPCKLGFSNRLFFVELCQELRHILLRKRGRITAEIQIDAGPAHQLAGQLSCRFLIHRLHHSLLSIKNYIY